MSPQWSFHNHSEFVLLFQINIISIHRLPLIAPDQISHEVLQMKQSQAKARTHPSSNPNGIIFISELPLKSNISSPFCSQFRNLSGLKAIGSSHTLGSPPISTSMKRNVAIFGTKKPLNTISSVTACPDRK